MKAYLDEEIRELRGGGASLRKIATTLHISHEAVRKRLRNLADREQVPTKERNQELTAAAIEKEKVSTGSNARKSRVAEQVKDTVNQVSTEKTPPLTPTPVVNPSGIASGKLSDRKKRVLQEVSSEAGDLVGAIKGFLEANGIHVYPIQVAAECYQAEHKGQVIRLYVHRKQTGAS